MAKEDSIIETGVDKLVELVRADKKISIPDAAKKLGVGPIVVEEWAGFLEEEGIISIEYKFATPYLVEKKLTQEEIKKKEKEFHGKKEGFVRKAEVTLAILDREGEDFQNFKNHFGKLKKELKSELVHVESELKQLEKFENLKNNIDKQILEQENEFRKKMESFENEINREQQKYSDIVENIDLEEEKLDRERLNTISLREKEMQLKNKLNLFQENIDKINQAIKENDYIIDDSGKKIKELKKKAIKIKKETSTKKQKGTDLDKQSRWHKQRILDLEKSILEKVEKNKAAIAKQIEDGKTSSNKFREFFDRKVDIENLMGDMEKKKDELESELIELIKKAKAFHLSSNTDSLKSHTKELEKTFENIKKKKAKFEQEAVKLGSLLKR